MNTSQRYFRVSLLALCLGSLTVWLGAAEKRVLTIFNWSEYIDPEVYRQFEQKYDCTIKETTFETPEEALNKMVAGGSRIFDVCAVGGNSMMPAAIAQGVLKPLDHARLPNLKHLSQAFRNPGYDPGNRFSIPYQWGTTGIFIRRALLPADGFSLAAFFDPAKQLGRFLLIDSEREMIGYAHIFAGKPLNSVDLADLKAAIAALGGAKKSKNFMGFDGGIGGRSKVIGGTADYAIIYSGDAIRVLGDNPGFTYVLPKEGAVAWVDQLCIAKDAPNADLAYAFLNHVLDPKVAAQISNWTKYPTPVESAKEFIAKEDIANPAIYPDEVQMKKLQFVEYLGDKETIRNDAWSAIKSG